MGFCGGCLIADRMIKSLSSKVDDDEARKSIYKDLIDVLWEMDWDTESEMTGIDPCFDSALDELIKDGEWP